MKVIAGVLALLLLGLAACSRPPAGEAAEAHAHRAPHGGRLVELGEHQFNLEFKYDEARGVLQAWLLDAHAEQFIRSELPGFEVEASAGGAVHTLEFGAVANAMSGETVGSTSQFEAPAAWLRAAKAFDGRVKGITVRGVRFADVTFRFSDHDDDHSPAAPAASN